MSNSQIITSGEAIVYIETIGGVEDGEFTEIDQASSGEISVCDPCGPDCHDVGCHDVGGET